MIRTLLAGAAALALISGGAMAQDSSTSTSTTTTTAPAPIPAPQTSYSKTTTKRSAGPLGESEHTRTFEENQAAMPDGSATNTTTRSHTESNGIAPPPTGDDE